MQDFGMNNEHQWQLWQLKLVGFCAPWWFLLLPWLLGRLFGARLTRDVSGWVSIGAWSLLLMGLVVSLLIVSSEGNELKWERTVARWFLLGLLSFAAIPVLLVALAILHSALRGLL